MAERGRQIPAETWAVALLCVVAAAIRVAVINTQSFWSDEALTAYEAHLSFGGMLGVVRHVETTPPLYFVLSWSWAHVLGSGEVALRSISTLAGVAMVPIAYLATRALFSRQAGLLAAALVAVNPFLIWYSQEARAYMLLAALSGASFLFFVHAQQDPSRRNLAWWGVCSALAVMTHFFASFAVAPEALWLLWTWRSRAVALAVTGVALVQLAMLPFAVSDIHHGAGWIGSVPRINRFSQAIRQWGLSNLYERTSLLDGLAAGAILIAFVTLAIRRSGDPRTRIGARMAGAVAGFVWLAPSVLAVLGQDYFLGRNAIPAFIPVVSVLAAACLQPRGRLLGGTLAAVLLTIFSLATAWVQTHPYLERPNWRSVAHALAGAPGPRAMLVANGATADALKIYLPRVSWIAPATLWVREVDVVGAIKRLRLARQAQPPLGAGPQAKRWLWGRPLPVRIAPPGTVLLARFRVHNWVLARFALRHPIRVSPDQLRQLAPRFFLHTPRSLLVLFQPPGR